MLEVREVVWGCVGHGVVSCRVLLLVLVKVGHLSLLLLGVVDEALERRQRLLLLVMLLVVRGIVHYKVFGMKRRAEKRLAMARSSSNKKKKALARVVVVQSQAEGGLQKLERRRRRREKKKEGKEGKRAWRKTKRKERVCATAGKANGTPERQAMVVRRCWAVLFGGLATLSDGACVPRVNNWLSNSSDFSVWSLDNLS